MRNNIKSKQTLMDIIKASRKINRLEEIKHHGKTIHHAKVIESKRNYKRVVKHKKDNRSGLED